jgi:hypothetical protein
LKVCRGYVCGVAFCDDPPVLGQRGADAGTMRACFAEDTSGHRGRNWQAQDLAHCGGNVEVVSREQGFVGGAEPRLVQNKWYVQVGG